MRIAVALRAGALQLAQELLLRGAALPAEGRAARVAADAWRTFGPDHPLSVGGVDGEDEDARGGGTAPRGSVRPSTGPSTGLASPSSSSSANRANMYILQLVPLAALYLWPKWPAASHESRVASRRRPRPCWCLWHSYHSEVWS